MAPAPEIIPEVAPGLEPESPGFLVPLALMSVFGVAAGLTWMVKQFVNALFGWMATGFTIPLIHKKISLGGVGKVEKAVVSALNDATKWSASRAAGYFHALADLFLSIGDELLGLSILAGYTAWYVTKKYALPVIEGRTIHVQRQQQTTSRQAKRAAQKANTAAQQATHPERSRVRAFVNDRVQQAELDFERLLRQQQTRIDRGRAVINHIQVEELPQLRARVRRNEKSDTGTKQHVGRIEKILTGLGIVGLVGFALARMGAGWLQCRNWKKIGRDVCKMPFSQVDSLLGLLTDFLILTNICDILPLLETAFSDVAAPLIDLLARAGAGICQGSDGPAPALTPPTLYLPSVSGTPTLQLP